MSFYEDQVLPRVIDRVLDTGQCHKLRAHVTQGLFGTVLEIGFGSGLNLEHYPDQVQRVLAVDPAKAGKKLSAERRRRARCEVDFVGLDGQSLPVPDGSVDGVLSTWTLCTIPDVARALSEVRRVLKPGAAFHFLEHGRAPDASIARWQARLNPVQKLVSGGCHLDRDVAALVRAAGFELPQLDTFYMKKTPRLMGFMYSGVAVA